MPSCSSSRSGAVSERSDDSATIGVAGPVGRLARGERILFEGRPAPSATLRRVALTIGVLLLSSGCVSAELATRLPVIARGDALPSETPEDWYLVGVAGVVALLAGASIASVCSVRYVITSRRLLETRRFAGIAGRRVTVRLPLAGTEARLEGRVIVLRKGGLTQASIARPEEVGAMLDALAAAAADSGGGASS